MVIAGSVQRWFGFTTHMPLCCAAARWHDSASRYRQSVPRELTAQNGFEPEGGRTSFEFTTHVPLAWFAARWQDSTSRYRQSVPRELTTQNEPARACEEASRRTTTA